MRLQIALPADVEEQVRALAKEERRDIRRQIEKIVIDSVRSPEPSADYGRRDSVVGKGDPQATPEQEVSHAR